MPPPSRPSVVIASAVCAAETTYTSRDQIRPSLITALCDASYLVPSHTEGIKITFYDRCTYAATHRSAYPPTRPSAHRPSIRPPVISSAQSTRPPAISITGPLVRPSVSSLARSSAYPIAKLPARRRLTLRLLAALPATHPPPPARQPARLLTSSPARPHASSPTRQPARTPARPNARPPGRTPNRSLSVNMPGSTQQYALDPRR